MLSTAPVPGLRPRRPDFGASYVLGTTLSVWFRGLHVFVPTTVLIFSPLLLLRTWEIHDAVNGLTGDATNLRAAISVLLQLSCGALCSAVFSFAVVRRLRRQAIGLGEALRTGLRRLPAALEISLLVALPVAAAILPAVLLNDGPVAIAATLLGLVVAIWVLVVWSLAIPATVIERLSAAPSLRRSASLTRGHRLSIFGSWLALLLLMGLVLTPLLYALFEAAPEGMHPAVDGTRDAFVRRRWVDTALQILLQSLQGVGVAVVYFALRASKEGLAPDELEKAFE